MVDPQWHKRWQEDRIGFHKAAVHEDLDEFADSFLTGAKRILIPLCGKSLDLDYLAGRGHEVIGVELVEKAVVQVFEDAGRVPEVRELGPIKVYRHDSLTVYCGDVFDVGPEVVGPIDRIWDRAALVALDSSVRPKYVKHLRSLAEPGARLLQNVMEYDQSVMDGPPWSISEAEIRQHYGDLTIDVLRQQDVIDEVRWKERGHQWWKSCAYLVHLT